MSLEKAKKLLTFSENDKLATLNELIEINENLKKIADKEIPELPSLTIPEPPEIQKVEIKGAEVVTIKGQKGDRGEEGKQGERGFDGADGLDGRNGVDGKNGKDGLSGANGIDGKDGADGKDGSPDTAEDIRNKLELLTEDERLDKKAIKGLEELEKMIKELKQQMTQTMHVGGGSGGGRIVKYHDLSASLNGATQTFALPAFWRVLQVNLSSFPNILRPTIDYTTDAGASTITFTSEIDLNALASGQTCMILYSE